jgi:hypothetical protein|tara:strand:+ start:1121 stop:1297 length:177 start_codon:yes stop_codon:yes gene_type:complete
MITKIEKIYNPENTDFIFRMTKNGIISDVPNVEANTDYQEIQQWIADGGTVIDNGGGE